MGNFIWILTILAGIDRERNHQIMFVSCYFLNFIDMNHKLKKCLNSRSSHQSCSIEKSVLKNFAIFTGKHLRWSLLLIDFRASRPATFFKSDSNTGIFLWILQNFLFWWKSANNCFCSSYFLLLIFLLGCLLLL